jgi:hypothetical protein
MQMFRKCLLVLPLVAVPFFSGCGTKELKPNTTEVKRDEEQFKQGMQQSLDKMPPGMRERAQQMQQQQGTGS